MQIVCTNGCRKMVELVAIKKTNQAGNMFRQFALLITLTLLYAFCHGQVKPSSDSVTVPTSLKYKNPSFFKRLFLGKNYRAEWSTPVTVPVFYFSKSGLKIKELGGGQQTKSLQLEDKNGKKWVLRTVDKDVTLALPKWLRGTLAQSVVQDMVSGAHPHAPMVVAELAKAAGIVAPDPVMYYVADDDGLNPYKHFFVNTLCFLEEREPTRNNEETKNTENLVEDVFEENDHIVLQKELLKARLLDMLVADWDRHEDQWRWAEKDSADVNYYYAIPRDRDQAFFYSKGLIVTIARWLALKHLVGFTYDTDKIKKLNYKAWGLDKTFLNELNSNDWQHTIDQFKASLTDEVIYRAVKDLPNATYQISGSVIEKKLKSRRNDLSGDAMGYYRFLSKVVTVNGSDDEEIFRVSENSGGLMVQVTNASGKRIIYQRVFDDEETKQVVLNGFGKKDKFIVEDGVSSKIKLVINGGKGDDTYDIKGKIKNKVYDDKSESNLFINSSRTKKRLK